MPTQEEIKDSVVKQLETVFDPEIPVNIYELGLIYDVAVNDGGVVDIKFTLTTPMCPAADILPAEIETKARTVEGATDVKLELVWDPPWDPSMMTDEARLDLGLE